MSNSDELAKLLEEAKAALKESQEFFAKVNAPLAELTNEETQLRESYTKQMEIIREKKRGLQEAASKASQKANQLAYQIEQLTSQKSKEEAEEAAKKLAAQKQAEQEAANLALTERWDKLTINAKWREWAKDHQLQAAHKIVQDRYVIEADPMGLGKTLVAIATCDMAERATHEADADHPFLGEEKEVYVPGYWVDSDGKSLGSYINQSQKETATFVSSHYENQIVNSITRPVGRKILYICPSSLIRNVMKEFREWAPHRNATYVGGMTKAEREFVFDYVLKDHADFVLVCNYEAWRKDFNLLDQFIAQKFDTVIIDEAHMIKDTKSNAYRGIKKVVDELSPEYVIPMTGTPILNKPQELFSLLTLVNPSEFFRLNDFLYSYCEQDDMGRWRFQSGGLDRISKRIRKNFIRRTRDQAGIELPPVTVINHDIEIDHDAYPEQSRVREQMRNYATIIIDESKGKAISAAAKIAVFTRLRQVETWPAGIKIEKKEKQGGKWVVVDTLQVDVRESQKVDYIIRHNSEDNEWDGLIPEVIEEERVVVFRQFKQPVYEMANRITAAGFRPIILDGSTSKDLRDEIANDFDRRYTPDRASAKWDIVLCGYKVGGVGLNFTAASQCIILDEEWNSGKRDQAYGRLDRIGQEHSITVHVVRAQETKDINGVSTPTGIDPWLAEIVKFKEEMVEGFEGKMVSDADFADALESGLI